MKSNSIRLALGVVVIVSLFVLSCGKTASDKLVGRWVVDWSASLEAAELSESEKATVEALASNLTISVEFSESGTCSVSRTEHPTQEGTWEVASTSGNTLTVHVRPLVEPTEEQQEVPLEAVEPEIHTFEFINDDQLMTVMEGTRIILTRH